MGERGGIFFGHTCAPERVCPAQKAVQVGHVCLQLGAGLATQPRAHQSFAQQVTVASLKAVPGK